MAKELQQILRKYGEKELTGNIVQEVKNMLKEKLDNVSSLSKEEINYLINFQDDDGSFKITTYKGFHGELAQDCYYYPSYLISLILINIELLNKIKVADIIIERALNFCVRNEFNGHGYDAYETQVDTAILFAKYNFKGYAKKHKNTCRKVSILLDNLLNAYEQMIQENKTTIYWGKNIKSKLEEFIRLYDDSIYYVAYGSNLNKEQMIRRCPSAKVAGTAYLKDYKLKFNLYLTIEESIGTSVPIGIWKITRNDEQSLDRYEGYPHVYRKEYIDIEVNNIIRKCIIYIMNDIPERKDVPPTKEYFDRCKKGYEDFGFDIMYLQNAI